MNVQESDKSYETSTDNKKVDKARRTSIATQYSDNARRRSTFIQETDKAWRMSTTRTVRRVSVIENPRLSVIRKTSSERRRMSMLDYDMSMLEHNRLQLNSYFMESQTTIDPIPASESRFKPEKKVIFNLESFPSHTKRISSIINIDLSRQLMASEILEDAVKFSLEHKRDVMGNMGSFMYFEESMVEESGKTPQESTSAFQPEPEPVELEGKLTFAGKSESYQLKLPALMPTSRRASSGGSQNLNIFEDVWPWPWLNPEHRARHLYKSPSYNPVTFAQQRSLPKMPLPVLGHTLSWVLQSVQPCVSAKTFAKTVKAVEEFASGEGKVYHDYLLKTCKSDETAWIVYTLPNYAHCYSRLESPMLNTAIVAPFVYDLWPEKAGSQLTRAAILVSLAVEFWELIREERLQPIFANRDEKPTCMHGFRKLFSSVKIPGIPRDEIFLYFKRSTETETRTPRHIAVLYKGQIFSLDVADVFYNRISTDDITRSLWGIMNSVESGQYDIGPGVGILTCLDRNSWSNHRVYLKKLSPDNEACLNEIEESMFVLSLDHVRIVSINNLQHEAIFADGCNRWYDKCLNLYIYNNGLVTASVNVSIVDGSTAAFLLHYIHLRIMEDAEKWDDEVLMAIHKSTMSSRSTTEGADNLLQKIRSQASLMSGIDLTVPHAGNLNDAQNNQHEPRIMQFKIDEQLENVIQEAKLIFKEMAWHLKLAFCRFEDYEKNFFAVKAIDTDAFAHLLLQLTYMKMYFRPASMGSLVSLRRFYHGRYEVLRSTTVESVGWCRLMLDPNSSFEDRKYAFFEAEKKHVTMVRQTISGKGCENHLAALRVIAEDHYNVSPKLFLDEGFRAAGGFGAFDVYAESLGVGCLSCPVVCPKGPTGYGVGYSVGNAKIIFQVSSWTEDVGTSADLLTCSLNRTMRELHNFLREL